jgi:NDP-sugar pyrophosphorylase family protein
MNLAIIETNNNSRLKKRLLKSSRGMININGEYLIERLIRIGRKNGIEKVYCIIDSHDPELEKYLSDKNLETPPKLIVPNLSSPMHILFALTSIKNTEPFVIVNTNYVFLESEFSEFVTYSLLQEDADGILAVTKQLNDEEPLAVAMSDEDKILKFNNSKVGYNWVNGGIYYFSPQILNETKNAFIDSISGIEQFLQLLLVKGYILKGFSFSKIIKVETVADIAKATDLIKTIE